MAPRLSWKADHIDVAFLITASSQHTDRDILQVATDAFGAEKVRVVSYERPELILRFTFPSTPKAQERFFGTLREVMVHYPDAAARFTDNNDTA